MTLLVVGCAVYDKWWPFFVIIFYMLAPIPMLLAKRYNASGMGPSNPCQELAVFLTMGIVISAFGLPIVLARSPPDDPAIQVAAMWYVLGGNIIVFLTIVGFFITFGNDDVDYSMW
ncbi:leptin receptor gene-related protein [Folsomia candida]|uniref:Leptin receptor gene-related protein n=1 Tax=Folsomia candida TaxID=158441 RepID=A0A226E198_FOLCA|nr:leptin receptor gene-related protein [Folsomia candida]XP_035710164.1 leptin receptor gene-related protein [Folsomia candida]OXA51058.1 Leptin receptor gene-related protein [Folsomia candida]